MFNLRITIFLYLCSVFFQTPCVFGARKSNQIFLTPNDNIQNTLDLALPCDIIYLRSGVYFQKIRFKHSGDAKSGPITLSSAPGEHAILDGSQTPPTTNQDQMILIKSKSFITVSNLEIRNFHQGIWGASHSAIFISGDSEKINIYGNQIHDIKTDLKIPGANAHAVAIYGNHAPDSLNSISIIDNEIYDLKLGTSEAISVNGNVEDFEITKNFIHDCDNIGIDVIGFEEKSDDERYDQARNGVISNNKIKNISSKGNPNYGSSECAGGIYVDGGRNIRIENNIITESDIGIEVASEHFLKSSSNILVTNNIIYQNYQTGISIGGQMAKEEVLQKVFLKIIFYIKIVLII